MPYQFTSYFVPPSVITTRAGNDYHFKTGQGSSRSGTSVFYRAADPKRNFNLPSFNVAPDSRAMVSVKLTSVTGINAGPIALNDREELSTCPSVQLPPQSNRPVHGVVPAQQ